MGVISSNRKRSNTNAIDKVHMEPTMTNTVIDNIFKYSLTKGEKKSNCMNLPKRKLNLPVHPE